jgi:hypothetical protein
MRVAVLLASMALAHSATAEIRVANAGLLRVQDKMTGVVSDFDLATGGSQSLGRLTVTLDECRYPSDLSMAEAYAHLTIMDSQGADPLFKGWMVASSPALSALDHPRYDVWVLRCDVPQTTEGEGSGG